MPGIGDAEKTQYDWNISISRSLLPKTKKQLLSMLSRHPIAAGSPRCLPASLKLSASLVPAPASLFESIKPSQHLTQVETHSNRISTFFRVSGASEMGNGFISKY